MRYISPAITKGLLDGLQIKCHQDCEECVRSEKRSLSEKDDFDMLDSAFELERFQLENAIEQEREDRHRRPRWTEDELVETRETLKEERTRMVRAMLCAMGWTRATAAIRQLVQNKDKRSAVLPKQQILDHGALHGVMEDELSID